MRIVIALGGNAFLQRGEPLSANNQLQNIKKAAKQIALIAKEHEIIITHGNGPQIGLLALQNEAYKEVVTPYPLDILNAETQGMIGYLLSQEIKNALPTFEVISLITRISVDPEDPAFLKPTKYIGPIYSEENALSLSRMNNWTVAKEGENFRRVVASPLPKNILELQTIKKLLKEKVILIVAGGGGIPVIQDENKNYIGIEAVIDKDSSSVLLAEEVQADFVLIGTDVAGVYTGWGTSQQTMLKHTTPAELSKLDFPAGSMGPKVTAACQFVRNTGKCAAIGALNDLNEIINGRCGTHIKPNVVI